MSLKLSSTTFENEGAIPEICSKQGGNHSPELSWRGIPVGTTSLVLIADDLDAPAGVFTHWLLYGIDQKVSGLPEHLPGSGRLANGARQGVNGFGEMGYSGPKPPSGTHRYFFHLYALDTDTDLPPGFTRQELDGAIEGHIIEEAVLIGTYRNREHAEGGRRHDQAEKART
ncbi:MAG: YbhB/YbcL family Raf kinase inhibitor-like protein [Acidobacteriota bacterium]|nr:YbhB/YbcL family Raf kinase inhibitor-like protein [Acidobacteriota bacterium]